METYTTGTWIVKCRRGRRVRAGLDEFASWASGQPGAQTMRLTHDLSDPQRFLSFAPWDDAGAIHAWKRSPEFRERMAKVRQHTEGFTPWELELVTAVAAGSAVSA